MTRTRQQGAGVIEALVDAAMSVFCYEDDYTDESIPHVKSNRAALRAKFSAIIHPALKGKHEHTKRR